MTSDKQLQQVLLYLMTAGSLLCMGSAVFIQVFQTRQQPANDTSVTCQQMHSIAATDGELRTELNRLIKRHCP